MIDDRRARRVRMGLEPDLGGDDLERRVGDVEVDLHVVHRQRVGIVGEEQARRLLVAHRAADQQAVLGGAVGAHAVLAVVEHLEPVGVGREDRVGAEHGPVVPGAGVPLSTRGTVNGDGHRAVHAARRARRVDPAGRRGTSTSWRGPPPRTARRTASPRCRRRPRRWPTTSGACWRRPPPERRCRSPSGGWPTAGSSAAPASWSCGGGAAVTSPTRSRSAARGWRPTPNAARSTPRPSCCCSPTPSSGGASCASPCHRLAQRPQPDGDRTHRRPLRRHAAPSPAGDGRRRVGPTTRHGAVRDHRRRLAGRPRTAETAAAIAYRRRLMARPGPVTWTY